jgi:hypothetical protein
LHDDDWVRPGFYATLRRGVESAPPSVGVAFCMYTCLVEANGTPWSPPPFGASAGLMDRNFLVRLARSNPLNLSAVVYRRETFERVGLFREDLPYTADWEWYVRSALQFAWHHQPEALAWYRYHANRQTNDLARSGRTGQDIRRTLELFARVLPSDVSAQVVPASRQSFCQLFLNTALSCLQAGNPGLAGRFLTEALAIDSQGVGRPEFAQLLQQPAFPALRHEVRAAVLRRFA